MARLHKFQRSSIFMLLIMLIFGMCSDAYGTDSFFSYTSTATSSFYSHAQITETPDSCIPEMLESRDIHILENIASRITRTGTNFLKTIYRLCPGYALVLQKGFHSVYSVIRDCPVTLNKNVITYIHKSDGKKRH